MNNRTSEAFQERLLPLFFCCQLATLGLLRQTSTYSLAADAIAGYPLLWLWIARILSVVVLVCATALALRGVRFLPHRGALAAAGTALVVGFALTFYGAHVMPLYVASQCLIGVAHAWVLVCWAEYLTGLPKAPRNRSIAVAALLAVFIFTIMAALPPAAAGICYLALACGSVVPLIFAGADAHREGAEGSRRAEAQDAAADRTASPRASLTAIPWELVALMASYAILFRILVFFDFPTADATLQQVVAAIVRIGGMGLLLLYLSRVRFTPSTQQLVAPLFFLTLVGLALLPQQHGLTATLAVALISSSWTFFYVLMWLVLPTLADERGASPFITLVAGWTILNVLLLLAAPIAYLFEVQVSQGTLSLTALVLIVVYTLTVALLLYRHSAKRAAPATAPGTPITPESRTAHFETLAQQHELTPREAEVFLMLVEGYSLPAIEEKFVLSHSTVKTHARHIYEKFGVRNKQELIALVKAPSQPHVAAADAPADRA